MKLIKTKIILMLCILIAGMSCNKNVDLNSTKAGIQNNRTEFIHLWFDAFNNRDTVFLLNSYAPDAVLEDPDHPWNPIRGNTEILKNYMGLFNYIPDVNDSVKTITLEGNKAAIEFIARGSIAGSPFRMRIMTLLEFDNAGKIVRDATYYDRKE